MANCITSPQNATYGETDEIGLQMAANNKAVGPTTCGSLEIANSVATKNFDTTTTLSRTCRTCHIFYKKP
ncbi:hypothetical protein ACFDR9_005582 [Janthinobacterium sp. CG_23.3]|uniref:hypothetical protein n=1 Tax=Janthinobacterium sp. CG_23.3 TaxID=3349634 RepID=UPI0038D3BDAA